jgi:hypothetical protein
MPVVEGRFRLVVTAFNPAANKTCEAERDVLVPPAANQPQLSELLLLTRFERDPRIRPFSFGGFKLYPSSAGSTTATRGLRLAYQLTVPLPAPPDIGVEYVVGGTANKVRKTFTEKLALKAADAHGSLLTSKALPLEEFSPGAYQVVVRVKDARTGRITATAAPFTIVAGNEEAPPVVVSPSHADTPQWTAANQYERALCWLSQGRTKDAIAALEESFQLSHSPAAGNLLRQLQHPSRAPDLGRANSNETIQKQNR